MDACWGGCGGIWFDNFELKKFDEPHEAEGEKLTHIEMDPAVAVDLSAPRKCPRCPEILLCRHFFSIRKKVEVDDCPQCGGVWLDAGELAQIRGEFQSTQDRKKAADAFFEDSFAERLEDRKDDLEETRARNQTILKMLWR